MPSQIPKVGGQEVDLHKLYIEVTKLGGLELVIQSALGQGDETQPGMVWRELALATCMHEAARCYSRLCRGG